MRTSLRSSHVFLNCPFDVTYGPIFNAIVFALYNLGFVPRCALEEDDSGELRLSKIERIIEEREFGIHDLSAVELDTVTRLPRFNMPLEFGLFLGCKRFGKGHQRKKACLILDSDRYRYRTFISDIAGYDIRAHNADPERTIFEIRDWHRATSKRRLLPGGAEVVERFRQFRKDLPTICARLALPSDRLTFTDLSKTIADWLRRSR